jgi:hypothetical protein
MNVLVVETNELGKFRVAAQEWWWPEVYQEFAGNSQEVFQRNKQQPPQLDHDGLLSG